MVSELVRNPVAHGAVPFGGSDRGTEAHTEKYTIEVRRKGQAEGLGRGCLEPSPGTRLLQEAKVSTGGLTLSRRVQGC